jgi:hypothetical protein
MFSLSIHLWTMTYASSVHNNRDSLLAEIVIFFLIVSQTHLCPQCPIVLKLQTLTQHFSIPSTSFKIWNLWDLCLFTASLSLTFATMRYWSVSQSGALNDWISITFECLHLSIRMWSILSGVFASEDIQVYLWMLQCGNIEVLTPRFLDVLKFITLPPLSLLFCLNFHFQMF